MSVQTTISMQNMVSPVLSSIVDSMESVISSAQMVNAKTGDMISTQSLAQAKTQLMEASAGIEQMTQEQIEYNNEAMKSPGILDGIKGKVLGVVGAYAGLKGIEKLVDMSDEMANTNARLNMIKADGEDLADLQNRIFAAAHRGRGNYQAMQDSVAKLGMQAGDAFANTDEIINFTEQLNKNFILSGTSAIGVESAMYQLNQAMAMGVLRGEEFNAVNENAPNIIQAIADKMGVTKGEVKALAGEGQITAQIIKEALMESAEATNAEFAKMPMTFEQIRQMAINKLIYGIQPHLQALNDFMNTEMFMGFVDNLTVALSMATALLGLFIAGFVTGFNILYNVIDFLKVPLMGLAVIMGIYYGAVLAGIAIEKAKAAWTAISTAATALLSAETRKATLAQWGLNTAILSSPLFWIPALIIGIITLISALIVWINKAKGKTVSAIGVVTGVIAAAISVVVNLFIGLLNHVITVAENIINSFIRVGEFLANFAKHPLQASLRLFQQFANNVLNILANVASTIDSIFGSDLASIVTGFQSSVGAWVDSQLSADYEKFEEVKLKRIEPVGNIAQAYKKGYDWGVEKETQLKEKFDPTEKLLDQQQMANDIANKTVDGLGGKDVGEKIKDIADSTKGIDKKLDKVDWDNNNLDALKGLMEMRAINDLSKEIKLEVYNEFTGNVSKEVDVKSLINEVTDTIAGNFDIALQGG